MQSDLAFLRKYSGTISGVCLLFCGLLLTATAPVIADEQVIEEEEFAIEVEEEFATEAVDLDVAGEKANSTTKGDDCQSLENTTENNQNCSSSMD